jgi:hypothetical protein
VLFLEKQFFFDILASSRFFVFSIHSTPLKVLQIADIFLISGLVHFLVGMLKSIFYVHVRSEASEREKDETELKFTAKEFPF